ncbi:MAG: 30S ribosomal protein S17 [bacterium]
MAKTLTGIVVSIKSPKTVVVLVERKFRHPLYQKVIKRSKRFKVHQDKIIVEVDDKVTIQETRPISRDKHFVITKNLKGKIKK